VEFVSAIRDADSGMRDDDSACFDVNYYTQEVNYYAREVDYYKPEVNYYTSGVDYSLADCLSVRSDVVPGFERCNSVSWGIDSATGRRVSATVDVNYWFYDPMFVANLCR